MLRNPRSYTLALAAASLALAPAAAHAATKTKVSKTVYPTVSSITPRKLTVGEKLTIHGTHFRAGKGKTTVVFLRKGAPSVFLKDDTATATAVVVTIPQSFQTFLDASSGTPVATMFHFRVLAAKFSKTWTQNSRSPLIYPLGTAPPVLGSIPASGPTAIGTIALSCEQAAALDPTGDADKDGLPNAAELSYKLDPCNPDTDGDGASDGYEYYAARDLNGSAYPYPGAEPWPNPLDPSDVNDDFDGDGLTMIQEYELWHATSGTFPLTAYSDGTQNTGGYQPVTTVAQTYLDLDDDGNLTDDERDADGDGLSNIVEFSYTGTQGWWKGHVWHYEPHNPATPVAYVEPWYGIRHFSNLDATNPDSDGDGIPDGADDQDNDGWSNFVEMQLGRDRSGYRVEPFNPCLPDPHASLCSRWIPAGSAPWPPYDAVNATTNTQQPGDAVPFGWPNQDYAAWNSGGRNTPGGVVTGPWNPMAGFFSGSWDGLAGPA